MDMYYWMCVKDFGHQPASDEPREQCRLGPDIYLGVISNFVYLNSFKIKFYYYIYQRRRSPACRAPNGDAKPGACNVGTDGAQWMAGAWAAYPDVIKTNSFILNYFKIEFYYYV